MVMLLWPCSAGDPKGLPGIALNSPGSYLGMSGESVGGDMRYRVSNTARSLNSVYLPSPGKGWFLKHCLLFTFQFYLIHRENLLFYSPLFLCNCFKFRKKFAIQRMMDIHLYFPNLHWFWLYVIILTIWNKMLYNGVIGKKNKLYFN